MMPGRTIFYLTVTENRQVWHDWLAWQFATQRVDSKRSIIVGPAGEWPSLKAAFEAEASSLPPPLHIPCPPGEPVWAKRNLAMAAFLERSNPDDLFVWLDDDDWRCADATALVLEHWNGGFCVPYGQWVFVNVLDSDFPLVPWKTIQQIYTLGVYPQAAAKTSFKPRSRAADGVWRMEVTRVLRQNRSIPNFQGKTLALFCSHKQNISNAMRTPRKDQQETVYSTNRLNYLDHVELSVLIERLKGIHARLIPDHH